MPPKYSAHDVARYRCATSNALMLLSSATPSLQSYHKAVGGTYTLVTLSERYGDAVLPEVTVVDMRREKAAGATSPISSHLASALAETISRGEQAILFLNRRGYNNFLSCRSCGEAVQCPRCSVALTYHVHRRLATHQLRGVQEPTWRRRASCMPLLRVHGTGTGKVPLLRRGESLLHGLRYAAH